MPSRQPPFLLSSSSHTAANRNIGHGDAPSLRGGTLVKPAKLSWIFILALASGVWAQKPDAGNYSQARYDVKVTVAVPVAVRDGIKLSVDLYRPDAPGKFP